MDASISILPESADTLLAKHMQQPRGQDHRSEQDEEKILTHPWTSEAPGHDQQSGHDRHKTSDPGHLFTWIPFVVLAAAQNGEANR